MRGFRDLSQYRACVATNRDEKQAFICSQTGFAVILQTETGTKPERENNQERHPSTE
jgi:hypothetical protein